MRALTKREKILIVILLVSIAVWGAYSIISPIVSAQKKGSVEKENAAGKIKKMDQLYDEYRRVRQEKTRLLTLLDTKNENTATLIQQFAATNNIEKSVAYTRRTQSNVQNRFIRVTTEVKIEGVAIQPLIRFIGDIENSNGLMLVQYLRITKGLKGTDAYDALIKIDSFTNK
jgi:hypothetical protein